MSEDKVVDVAVGVLIREDGRVLLASRPEGKPWAGYWEFPGGKLEDGETVHQALVRELDEELGVRLADSFPWFVKEHRYEHAHVRLHFRRSRDFFGEALSKEGQDFGFYAANERTPGVLLPIDQNILNRVDLPDVWEDSTAVLTLSAPDSATVMPSESLCDASVPIFSMAVTFSSIPSSTSLRDAARASRRSSSASVFVEIWSTASCMTVTPLFRRWAMLSASVPRSFAPLSSASRFS